MALPYASLGCLSLHARGGWVSTFQVGGHDACRAVRDRWGALGCFLLPLTPGAQVPAEKAAGGLPVPEGGAHPAAEHLQGPSALEHICLGHSAKKMLTGHGCHQGSEAGGWKE